MTHSEACHQGFWLLTGVAEVLTLLWELFLVSTITYD